MRAQHCRRLTNENAGYLCQAQQLTTVWGLNLLSLTDSARQTIERHIVKNNLNISLHHGVAPEPCRQSSPLPLVQSFRVLLRQQS